MRAHLLPLLTRPRQANLPFWPAIALAWLLLMPRAAAAQGDVIYVTANGSGGGTSWAESTNLLTALALAGPDDEIWVAGGIYVPGSTETSTFQLSPGVSLYGGFAGTESSRDARDWLANPTVLSGDLDGDDTTDDDGVITVTSDITGTNANHVLSLDGTSVPITESTVIDGITITGGQANGAGLDSTGGGLFCDGSGSGSVCSPTMRNVAFSGNSANFFGGAIYNDGSEGVSSPALTNVRFAGNSAGFGGALSNIGASGVSNPTMINVIFTNNSAAQHGGAIYNFGSNGVSSPTLTNVTFSDNSAVQQGGAIYNVGENGASSPALTNVILWNNSASSGSQIYNEFANATVAFSIVQGGNSGIDGGTAFSDGPDNLASDPQFVDAATGDLRLQLGSPAIDAGDSSAVPAGLTVDFAGNPRIFGSAVDIGAYEAPPNPLFVDDDATGADTGGSWSDALTDLQAALRWALPGSEIWVASGIYVPGTQRTDTFALASDVALYGGFAGTENSLDARDWQENATVLSGDIGGDDSTDGSGVVTDPDNIVGDNVYHVFFLDGRSVPITESTVIDGVVITAGQADGSFQENDGGGLYCNGSGAGSVCSPLLANVAFRGNTATSGGAMYNNGEYGVASPTLTGVTFSSNSAGTGGAMHNYGESGVSSPTVTGVTFSKNSAYVGGAMYNNGENGDSSPTLTDVTFSGNSSESYGGAMYSSGPYEGISSPTLTDVTFSGNTSVNSGGAMFNEAYADGDSSPILTDVTFSNNQSNDSGGAIYNDGQGGTSSPSLTGVTFSGNSAEDLGGAIFNNGEIGASNPTMTNVAFSKNSAGIHGGALYNYSYFGESSPTMTNVTFSNNSANTNGGAIYNDGDNGVSSPALNNVILWGNTAADGTQIYNNQAEPTIGHSIVQGGNSGIEGGTAFSDGANNLNVDPRFVDAANGDLRLLADSPAIDAGDNDADLDGGGPGAATISDVLQDLAGNPRIAAVRTLAAVVDMGAFERVNGTPTFTSSPDASATEESAYSYTATTEDDTLGIRPITAPTKPDWLAFADNEDGTATLSGTPQNGNVGEHTVVLRAQDAFGASGYQTFTLTVLNTNDPPSFTSTPATSATVGQAYSYAVTTVDADVGDTRTITALTKPAWLALTDNGDGTAELAGTPGAGDAGTADVVLQLEDAEGLSDQQVFAVSVSAAPSTTGGLTGQATADGAGVPGVTVSANTPAAANAVSTAAVIAQTVTDDQGKYGFNDLTPGPYTLTFEPPSGFETPQSVDVVVEAGKTKPVETVVLNASPTDAELYLFLPNLFR